MHSCGSFQAYAVSDQFLFLLPKLSCSHSSLIILTYVSLQNFCIKDLDLFSQFLFYKLLELTDWDLKGI